MVCPITDDMVTGDPRYQLNVGRIPVGQPPGASHEGQLQWQADVAQTIFVWAKNLLEEENGCNEVISNIAPESGDSINKVVDIKEIRVDI